MENLETRMFRQYFKIDEIRQKERIIIATLSTENPVERFEGYEVLVHTPEAIDLSRAPLPLITSHEADKQTPIGRVDNLRIVNRKLKGDLIFGKSKRATELWNDVQDNIARHLSVGYIPLKKTRPDSTGTYYVTKWQPLETSIVSTPADIDAVIGRNLQQTNERQIESMRNFYKEKKRDYSKIDAFFAREPKPAEFLRHLANAPIANEKIYGNVHPSLRTEGLSGGEASGAGFLAPSGWTDRILYHKWGSKIFKLCNSFKVEYNSMKMPALQDSDRSEGLFENMPVYQVAEADEKTFSKLKLMANWIDMRKTCGIVAVTDELIQDAKALEQWLFDTMAKAIAWDLDRQIIRGNGTTDSMLGLLFSPAKIVQQKEVGQTSQTLVLENCTKAIGRLTPEALTSKSTAWIVNPEVLPQMYTMSLATGTGGGPALPAYRFKGPSGEDFDTFLGFPVIPCEHASPLGSKGDCILASLDRFLIATRSIKKATSSHWGFLADETAFRMVLRSWGQLDHAKQITPYNGGSTLSSVIVIADRA